MNRILWETLVISFWTFCLSVIISSSGTLLLGWPLTVTYMMAVLTLGPTLAILRGRNREKDRLDIGERAGVEILVLVLLLGIGWLFGQYAGR